MFVRVGLPAPWSAVPNRIGVQEWPQGLGAEEYAFMSSWDVKGECLYISAVGTGARKDQLNLLRFGANYKFLTSGQVGAAARRRQLQPGSGRDERSQGWI